MECNAEHLKDAAEAGNINPFLSLLRTAIRNNKALTPEQVKRATKYCSRLQLTVIRQAWPETFKDDLN